MAASEYFSGMVHSVIFENAAQDFYIFRLVLDAASDSYDATAESGMFTFDSNKVVVRGNVPGLRLKTGSWVGLEGKWVTHDTYGKQVQVLRAPVIREWTAKITESLLTANGVGPSVSKNLAKHFGEKLVEVLNEGEAADLEPAGLTPLAAEHVVNTWFTIRAYYNTLGFLNTLGLPKKKIAQIWQHFGDEAEKVLAKNPWRLVEIEGINFGMADEAARRLSLDMEKPERMVGAVYYATKVGRGMGHVFMTLPEVISKVHSYISDATPKQVATALATCHKQGKLVLDRKTSADTTAVYEVWLYKTEQEAANLLKKRMEAAKFEGEDEHTRQYIADLATIGDHTTEVAMENPTDVRKVARAALEDWSRGAKIDLSEDQMQGALNAVTEPVAILTGLPGTGKTTTLRAVVNVLRNAGVKFQLVAPTGIAAKRLSSVTGAQAATIHRAFGAKGAAADDDREHKYSGIVGSNTKKTSEDGSASMWDCSHTPHPADVIICDESSMVDQHLMWRIMTCTKPTTRIVLVGDAAQLPSVGAGNVLREMIESKLFPTTNLTEIYRQAEASQIVTAAHAIHRGDMPELGTTKEDFVLVSKGPEEDVLEVVCRLATRLYDKKRNFQIISPKHGGTVGVTNLNARVRELLNPQTPGLSEMRIGDEVLREGDRIMVVKNDYELNIFNGDVGKVTRLDKSAREVEVKVHGPPVTHVRIPFKKAARQLRMAYAMTVHKCQGMEYDVILMPVVKSFNYQLQRNLLYTAVTRAKAKVILVGHRDALARAVYNSREDSRNTLFGRRLELAFVEDM